jgi:radical SAM protein with 4Fe4S-binding SPASM domain
MRWDDAGARVGRWIEIQPVPGTAGRDLFRAEPFGATVAFRKPEMLVLVDGDFLGSAHPVASPHASRLDPAVPFEVHLTVGHRCDAGCKGCYIDARPDSDRQMDPAECRRVLRRLSSLGVYHVALGAGESTPLEHLVSLARVARDLGMTPNLSTAGRNLTPRLAKTLSVFGRVHMSMDGVGDGFADVRGRDGFAAAMMSLERLRAYHPRVGVNCVVARTNFDHLEDLFDQLKRNDIREVELLRFKPAGRGKEVFGEMDLTPAQYRSVVPRVLGLARRYRMRPRLDCSFAPMVCAGGYDPGRLTRMGLAGCVGGSWLVAVDGAGRLSACSFEQETGVIGWEALGEPGLFAAYRHWTENAPEPCASCRWLSVCRGGCHVVARYVTGDFHAPDPGCPIVREYQSGVR